MADVVQSSGLNDFSKDADVLAAKIEMIKKQVDQLAASLAQTNSQFKDFSKAAGKTYNLKTSTSSSAGRSGSKPELSFEEKNRRAWEKYNKDKEKAFRAEQAMELKRAAFLRKNREAIERARIKDERIKQVEQFKALKAEQKREAEHIKQTRLGNRIESAQRKYDLKVQHDQAKYEANIHKDKEKMYAGLFDEQQSGYAAYKARMEKEEADAAKIAGYHPEKPSEYQKFKNEVAYKKQEQKKEKNLKDAIACIGMAITAVKAVTKVWQNAFETIAKLGTSNAWGNYYATGSNNLQNLLSRTANAEKAKLQAEEEAFTNSISTVGIGWTAFRADLLGGLNKLLGTDKDYAQFKLTEQRGNVNAALLGLGASGSITDQLAKNAIEDAIHQAVAFDPTLRNYSLATIMNTDMYKQLLERNVGMYGNVDEQMLKGYLAQKYGYGYAMLDLSQEQKMAYASEMMYQTRDMSQKEYNDMVKQWKKTGRIIEKFGKNLYAFDEVLSNDPFSNEDVENIDRTTGDIENQLNDMQETTTAEIGTVADNIGNLEDEVQTTNDALNTTNTDVTNIKENVKKIVDWLNKLKLNINITLPSQDDQYDASTDITTIINKLDDIVNFYNKLNITESDNIIIYKPGTPSTPGTIDNPPENPSEEPSNVVSPEGKQRALDALTSHLEFMTNLISLYTDYMNEAVDYSDNALDNRKNFLQRENNVKSLIADIKNGTYDSSTTEQWTEFINGIISYETDVYKHRSDMMPMEGILEFATLLENLYDSFGIEPITHSGGGHRFANGGLATKKMPTLSTLFEEGPEMVLPLNAAGADFLATSLNNLGLSNRLTNNSANVNVNLSGINIADNDREWYEVAHKIHNIIEAEQARQGG